MSRRRSQAGLTLVEVLIAVTLLSLLTLGMAVAMRLGLSSFSRVDDRLMENRRVAGAQQVLESELEGMMPVTSPCLGGGKDTANMRFVVFQAEPQAIRLVTTFSLQQGWRGAPQVLEMFVIAGENGRGVRLVQNAMPYTQFGAGQVCGGVMLDPDLRIMVPKFVPVMAKPTSFVLADKLAYCRFSYYSLGIDRNKPPEWRPNSTGLGWPLAVRVEMAPLDPNPAHLQPISVTAPIRIHRDPNIPYGDF